MNECTYQHCALPAAVNVKVRGHGCTVDIPVCVAHKKNLEAGFPVSLNFNLLREKENEERDTNVPELS